MPSLLKANRRVLKTAIALQWRAIIVLSRYSTYYSVSVSSTLLSSSREGGTAARELLRARHQIDVRLQHPATAGPVCPNAAQHRARHRTELVIELDESAQTFLGHRGVLFLASHRAVYRIVPENEGPYPGSRLTRFRAWALWAGQARRSAR